MRFSHPHCFWLLLLLVPVAWRIWSTERFLERLRHRFRFDRNGRGVWRLYGRCLLPLLGLAGMVAALAGPAITVLRQGNISDNLVLAIGIDVSKSMLAEDMAVGRLSGQPAVTSVCNRLNAARQLVLALLSRLEGEKVGLFFFARNGIEVVSPTRDHGFLRYMATHTDLGDLTESGSNLIAALDSGILMAASQTGTPARAVILLTDGEDTENNQAEILQSITSRDAPPPPVFTIGIGRERDVFIPIRRKGAADIDGFFTDSEDIPLKTRLDARTLRAIAETTGGSYIQLTGESLDDVASQLLRNIGTTAATPADLPPRPAPFDLAPLFLATGLLCYILFLLL